MVAHSYGANAALLAAQSEPALIRTLTLLEPACVDLARGKPAVEEHIAAMTPVFVAANDPAVSTREFSRLVAAGMGLEAPDLPERELEANVTRLRALRPPWGIGLRRQAHLPVPTIVLTGGWSPLYEEIAQSLVTLGSAASASCWGRSPSSRRAAGDRRVPYRLGAAVTSRRFAPGDARGPVGIRPSPAADPSGGKRSADAARESRRTSCLTPGESSTYVPSC